DPGRRVIPNHLKGELGLPQLAFFESIANAIRNWDTRAYRTRQSVICRVWSARGFTLLAFGVFAEAEPRLKRFPTLIFPPETAVV
ncbi:hypothetical protein, partial [Mesomycoplasma ovipneumoniae]|uniref:hypothetical protein n=1 Tax=Mesomycoplasma ovipneumoniae TaxID=29562 RepID=UPI00311A542E